MYLLAGPLAFSNRRHSPEHAAKTDPDLMLASGQGGLRVMEKGRHESR